MQVRILSDAPKLYNVRNEMTFNEFVKNCSDMIAEDPSIGEFDVVYSCDDEGNRFDKVFFKPSLGTMDEYNEFISKENLYEHDDRDFESMPIESKVVCIN